MSPLEHYALLARYNRWMNDKLHAAAATLPAARLGEARGAYFGSLLGTLNHIVVADLLWLRRFRAHPRAGPALAAIDPLPQPQALDQILCASLAALSDLRRTLDEILVAWVDDLVLADLDLALPYRRVSGAAECKRFDLLLLHFFNHQTHHRGQASTLLTQDGVDPGVTDLLALIPAALPPGA